MSLWIASLEFVRNDRKRVSVLIGYCSGGMDVRKKDKNVDGKKGAGFILQFEITDTIHMFAMEERVW